jgi:hypothetical protein
MNRVSFILGALCLLLVICGAAMLSRAGEDADTNQGPVEKRLAELLKERVTTAERAADATQAAFEAATVTLDVLIDAVNKLGQARFDAATSNAGRLEALEKQVDQLRKIEERILALYRIGARGGEAKDHAMAKRELQSAEIALLKLQLDERD